MSEDQLCIPFPIQEVGAIRWRQEEQNLELEKHLAPHVEEWIEQL